MASIKGGEKLDAAMRDLAAKLGKPASLRVGFMSDATYPDGTSVALIAAINEFGAPSRGQPPRPFFRNAIAAYQSKWPASFAEILKQTNYDVDKTLRLMGEGISGQIRQSIVDTNEPPLSPATIRRKGFDKPLIHHSVMINSVDFEVNT